VSTFGGLYEELLKRCVMCRACVCDKEFSERGRNGAVANQLSLNTDKIHTEFRNVMTSTSKDLIRELV
jgi:hypothetical protein